MVWQLIDEGTSKYFQFKWKNNIAVYTTKFGEIELLQKSDPVLQKQIHSDIILDVDSDDNRVGDGLISQQRNITLGVKIADCLPVYLFGEKKICIIHCGWHGIIKGIAKKAARLLSNYKYVLGASIGPCCYEIKEDVAELFKQRYKRTIISKEKKYFLDLKAAIKEDLGKKNLLAALPLCTKCHPEYFYSYRRGDNKKRNYALISRS